MAKLSSADGERPTTRSLTRKRKAVGGSGGGGGGGSSSPAVAAAAAGKRGGEGGVGEEEEEEEEHGEEKGEVISVMIDPDVLDCSICYEPLRSPLYQDQIEHVAQSQEELGGPSLSIEEHLTQTFGARSGHLRGLGCGPKPLSAKNLTIKASEEYIERQIDVLKEELKQSRVDIEERAQREKIEREERFKKEIEEIKAQLKIEFNEQLKIIVESYGVPRAPSPSSSRGVPTTSSPPNEG